VKIVIVGCGRVGAVLAESFDTAGHEVIVIDTVTRAFDRLSSHFGGHAVRGDGTDADTLRRAGAEDADVFLALTEGDNRNVMAAQVAAESLNVGKVVAKINDPVRAAAYADLGITAICRTTMMSDAVHSFLGMGTSGIPSVILPTRPHHGDLAREAAAAASGPGGPTAGGQPPRGGTASGGPPAGTTTGAATAVAHAAGAIGSVADRIGRRSREG
jgi:trk system potassium uptake protein TrkA